jgi:replicative DNA helicase
MTRRLKGLARDMKLPILCLAQLNRQAEVSKDNRPKLSHLRECVTGDTLVQLADGRRVPIRDLVGTEPVVYCVNEKGRITTARSDAVWRVGHRPVFEVRLASGRSIRATAEHRFLAADGWRRVAELNAGGCLAIADSRQLFSQGRRAREMAVVGACAGSYEGAIPSFSLDSADLRWDRIVSITPAGEEDVYDLTVPGPANWIADGIVTHNSGAIEQDADVVMFVHREEYYRRGDDAQQFAGQAEIIVAKQRNGPVGDVELTWRKEFTRFENPPDHHYNEFEQFNAPSGEADFV